MTALTDIPPSANEPTLEDIRRIVSDIERGSVVPELTPEHILRIVGLIGGQATRIGDLEAKLEIAHEALHQDSMTGLLNGQGFEHRFSQWLAETAELKDRRIAIIYVDIDRLKDINDKYSHAVGDKAIKRLAKALAMATRSDDIVARLHGDEFALGLIEPRLRRTEQGDGSRADPSLTDIDIEKYVKALPNRINESLKTQTDDSGDATSQILLDLLSNIEFSYGGVIYGDEELNRQSVDDLLHVADQRMYSQKHAARAELSESDSIEYHI